MVSHYSDGKGGDRRKVKPQYKNYKQETVEDVLQYPFDDWKEAGIRKETMEYFGCRVKYTETVPQKLAAIYFPAWSKDGKRITGFQKKNLEIPKEEAGHFSAVGSVRNTCMLYGQKQCQHGGKKLWVTEGWRDLMSAYQALKEKNKGTKWEKLNPSVCSIVNGTSNCDKSIGHNEDFVRSFGQIVICMDNDERLPIEPDNVIRGKEAEELIGSYLSSNNLLVPNYPDDRNDLNEILLEDGYLALHDLLMWNVKPYQADKIVTFDEVMTFEEAIAPVQHGAYVDGFPKLMDQLLGFRDHELTVVTGLPKTGKSSLCYEFMHQFMEKGEKIGLIMLEDPIKKTQKRMAARRLKVHPNIYKFDPQSCGKTMEELREAWEYSINPDNCLVVNHFGSIMTNSLVGKVKSLYASGCKKILIDHISLAISGRNTQDERKDLDVAMTELVSFRAAHPVHIFLVCHLNRKGGNQDGKRPTEPTWKYTFKSHLRGSAGLEQMACNIIGIHREDLPDGKVGRIMLGVLAARETGGKGDCDISKMDKDTGLWYDASEEIWTPHGNNQGY